MSDQDNSTHLGEAFDEARGFRETFLSRFTDERDRKALLRLAEILFAYWGEHSCFMPDPPLSPTRADLEAVLLDLVYLVHFLRQVVGTTPDTQGVSVRDRELATLATNIAGHLEDIAEVLDGELSRES